MTKRFHITWPLSDFDRMSDELLDGVLIADGVPLSVTDVRDQLKQWRDAGLVFVPCDCKTRNLDGSCNGWESKND